MPTEFTMGAAGWCRCGSQMKLDDQGRPYCSDEDLSDCIPPAAGATLDGRNIYPHNDPDWEKHLNN